MINYILHFFKPNLGKVLSQFESTITKLEEVESHHRENRSKELAKAAAATISAEAHAATLAKAVAVKVNIKSLLGK